MQGRGGGLICGTLLCIQNNCLTLTMQAVFFFFVLEMGGGRGNCFCRERKCEKTSQNKKALDASSVVLLLGQKQLFQYSAHCTFYIRLSQHLRRASIFGPVKVYGEEKAKYVIIEHH